MFFPDRHVLFAQLSHISTAASSLRREQHKSTLALEAARRRFLLATYCIRTRVKKVLFVINLLHFQLRVDRFGSLHVKALKSIRSVDFGHCEWMERNYNGQANVDA